MSIRTAHTFPTRLLLGVGLLLSFAALLRAQVPIDTSDAGLAAYALKAWETAGRASVSEQSGLRWDSGHGWSLVPDWPGEDDAAAKAYFVEPPMRGMLALASATKNVALLEDAAGFFLAYLGRFRTVAEVQAAGRGAAAHSPDAPQGAPTARILPWLDRRPAGNLPAECVLCSTQFMHPVARLFHLIALLPPAARSSVLEKFVDTYAPILVQEHLIRVAYETRFHGNPPGLPDVLVPLWQASGTDRRYRMLDRDLWLIATAAEVLEAHHLAPDLVPLFGEEERLRHIVTAGTAMLRLRTTAHSETKNAAGMRVGSLGYFEGDFDSHPDMSYSGYTTAEFPQGKAPHPAHGASWDVSHVQRLPVALRSLWDARLTLPGLFPDSSEIALTVNQYLYRAFQGDFSLPLLNNFFDGSDGWYRVGYANRGDWGYPPANWCGRPKAGRPCLSPGGFSGWGLLAFISPDLERLGASLVALGASTAPAAVDFRGRVFATNTDGFAFDGPPSALLGQIVSEYLCGKSAQLW